MRLAESRKRGGMASFSGVTRSMAARERRIEPSQTPKFLSPFPWERAFVFGYCCPIPPTPWPAAPRVVGPYEKRRPWGTCDQAGAPFIRSVDIFNQN